MTRFFNYVLIDKLSEIKIDTQNETMTIVNCLNPHSFVVALKDEQMRNALEMSDYLLPDGVGIGMVVRWYEKKRIDKIAGYDFHSFILEQLKSCEGKVYYMGSSEKVLKKIEERLGKEAPNVKVRTHSPSYCDELPEEESRKIIDDINEFSPDVLYISMTAPKQEKWLQRYRNELKGVKLASSIGAAFEFYAGTKTRGPRWMIKMKME
nr:WecB/TagA/CpsF family glycosyltransferase [Bacteroidales bacterium]